MPLLQIVLLTNFSDFGVVTHCSVFVCNSQGCMEHQCLIKGNYSADNLSFRAFFVAACQAPSGWKKGGWIVTTNEAGALRRAYTAPIYIECYRNVSFFSFILVVNWPNGRRFSVYATCVARAPCRAWFQSTRREVSLMGSRLNPNPIHV